MFEPCLIVQVLPNDNTVTDHIISWIAILVKAAEKLDGRSTKSTSYSIKLCCWEEVHLLEWCTPGRGTAGTAQRQRITKSNYLRLAS